MAQQIISPTQICLYRANLYLFSKEIYTNSDKFYLLTSDSELRPQSRIIMINTLYNNVTDIKDSDYVNNIYLYRQWSNSDIAVFIRDLVQETADKLEASRIGTPIVLPPSGQRLRNLEIRNTGAIKNPTNNRIVYNQLEDITTINFSFLN